MSDNVIRVEGLSKQYVIGGADRASNMRELLTRAIAPWTYLRRKRLPLEQFWALDDVSFEVRRGEVVGIIGRNGAGKSTLLKVLSRITEPTRGRVRVRGRMGSLLEVGTGFHPELTGRENIFLNGAILGMTQVDVRNKFDEIVSFAEVEKFIDTPVKHYSSGMYLRLAFSVAAHLEPEILIVDEVLAVGDAEFQKKCLGKMNGVAGEGRTVLFVSHNLAAIQQLTKSCVVLHKGKTRFIGNTKNAIEHYLAVTAGQHSNIYLAEDHRQKYSKLDRRVELKTMRVHNVENGIVQFGQDIEVEVSVLANETQENFRLSFAIYRLDGTPVGASFAPAIHSILAGEEQVLCLRIPHPRLAPGKYYFDIAIGKGSNREKIIDFDIASEVCHFEVVSPGEHDSTMQFWYPGWGSIEFSSTSYSL